MTVLEQASQARGAAIDLAAATRAEKEAGLMAWRLQPGSFERGYLGTDADWSIITRPGFAWGVVVPGLAGKRAYARSRDAGTSAKVAPFGHGAVISVVGVVLGAF